MDFETRPINNIEQAKDFFQAMDCNHFHMEREYPQWYEAYKNLSIPKRLEREWTYEAFYKHINALRSLTTEPSKLWWIHSRAADLAQRLKTKDALEQIYEATEEIVDRLPVRSKVIVAETINGRGAIKYRHTGLIFLAYHLGRLDLAERFSEISLALSFSARKAGIEPERCDRAIKTCREIRKLWALPDRCLKVAGRSRSRVTFVICTMLRKLKALYWYLL